MGSPLRIVMISPRLSLTRLVLAGVVMPALIVIINDRLLSSLAEEWRPNKGVMVAAMSALVVEIGLIGVVCGQWIDWPLLRWVLYGWCWLVVDLQVFVARQMAIENLFGATAAFLTGSLVAAQLGLVTIWAVLGTMRWSTRWPASFVLASFLAVPLIDMAYSDDNAALFFLVQFATTVGISALLRWNGFRLVLVPPTAQASFLLAAARLPTSQFGLGHMLVWTTALAIVLAVLRLVSLPWDEWANAGFLRKWLVFASSGVGVGVALIIAIWAALGPQRPVRRWALALLVIPIVALASGLVEWIAWIRPSWNDWEQLVPWFGRNWPDYFDSERWLIAWICLAGGMLFASLLFLRSVGYRLDRIQVRNEGPEPASPAAL